MDTGEKIDKFEKDVKDLIRRLREYNDTDAGFLSISDFNLDGTFEYDFEEMEGSASIQVQPEQPPQHVEINMDLGEKN